MQRRDFLRALGIGAAAAAVPALLVPERRIWQVSRNAPVGGRVRSIRGMEQHAGYLVTDADYTQRIVRYDVASREFGLRELALRSAPEPWATVEEYEHLLSHPVDRAFLASQRDVHGWPATRALYREAMDEKVANMLRARRFLWTEICS